MTGVLAHLRTEARRRWTAWFGVVLLVGVVGGLALGAAAGARRTHTAYDRLVADTEARDRMLLDTTDPTHVMVDDVVAEHYGIDSGDRVQIATGNLDELIEWEMASGVGESPMVSRDAVVTGVATAHDGGEGFGFQPLIVDAESAAGPDLAPLFVGVVVAANLLAVVPGLVAGRTRPATMLRAE